ncbi:hypothetical protein XPR_3101 [Xanthomonas arboricola pv. pruni MAFF 301420]|uniref:Glucose dehydrogenase n=1 Tax=Xanthomonas arboricola pv. pruni MAFF 301420 TaxID=1418095 RepID=W4SIY9_9XANT|nr:hypothetical protein XPR_3101 [Xanthomonas arboricola pv. pruni MAFF 301420]
METKSKLPVPGRALLLVLGMLIALVGLIFLLGGARLASLGGSWYFLLMGLATALAGVLIVLRRPAGALVYGVAFALTLVWALWDAGLEFWPLVSRLMLPAAFAVLVFWPLVSRLMLLRRSPCWWHWPGQRCGAAGRCRRGPGHDGGAAWEACNRTGPGAPPMAWRRCWRWR